MKSFTLIELLVVISIILILTISLVPNFHLADSRIALERAAYKMAQQIRNVEEMAMSAKGTPASKFVSNLFPQGGYGLYFDANEDSDSYIIFADCDGDTKYNYQEQGLAANCKDATKGDPYPYEKVEEVFLDSGIKIKQTGGNQLNSVLFLPPDPEIIMQPDPPSNPSVTLYSTRETTRCMVVYVNEVGNVEINSEECN